MHLLRRLVYQMGFRPGPGSIWYSPSHNFVFKMRDLWRQ